MSSLCTIKNLPASLTKFISLAFIFYQTLLSNVTMKKVKVPIYSLNKISIQTFSEVNLPLR